MSTSEAADFDFRLVTSAADHLCERFDLFLAGL